jgi:Ca2+-binding RTX toxin-like protein
MPSLTGTPGNDIFTGGIDNDTAAGLGGSDSLSGADGGDVLAGGSGADTLDGGAGEDVLYSGDQSPAYNLPWYNNNYVLPLMDTGTEVDVLRGGDGSDRIFAGYGDSVDGGTNRTYGMGDYLYISFQGAPAGVTADFHQTTLTIGGGVITNMEYVSYAQGSQFGDNLTMPGYTGGYSDFTALSGMGGDDTLTAGYETGSLLGDEGDDVLDGRPSQYLSFADGGVGNDTIYMPTNSTAAAYGGAGEDTIYAQGVTHGGAGDDTITMQASYYGGLVYGDEGDDRITASPWGSSIAGGSGSDVIVGGDANDQLSSADFAGLSGGAADDLGLEQGTMRWPSATATTPTAAPAPTRFACHWAG